MKVKTFDLNDELVIENIKIQVVKSAEFFIDYFSLIDRFWVDTEAIKSKEHLVALRILTEEIKGIVNKYENMEYHKGWVKI